MLVSGAVSQLACPQTYKRAPFHCTLQDEVADSQVGDLQSKFTVDEDQRPTGKKLNCDAAYK